MRYVNSPLRFDEADWRPQAEGILRHGVPLVPYEEDKALWISPYYGADAHYGMWHPPVYVYSLAASIAAFGSRDWAIRGVSAAWMAAAAWLAWCILQMGGDGSRPWALRALPLAVAFLSPLVIEGSFYVDIDNSSLAAAMFLMAYVHLKLDRGRPFTRGAALAVVTTFALWSKLTTPVAMALAIVLHRWLQRGARPALADAAALAAAVPLFGATYWAYCAAFDYPAWFMFEMSYMGKRDVYTSVKTLHAILQAVRWNVIWISPAVVLATLFAASRRVQRYARTRQVDAIDLLLMFGVLALAQYVAFGLIGKYTVPAALALALVAGHEIAGSLTDRRIARPGLLASIALVLAAVHAWLGPLQLRPPPVPGVSVSLAQALADPRNAYLLVSVLAGVAAVLAVARARPFSGDGSARPVSASRTASVGLGLLVYIAAANPLGELRLVAERADRSPLRPFVDSGFREVVAHLNEMGNADTVILAPKDVGSYFRGRHYPAEIATRDLQELSASRPADIVVDSRLYPVLPDWGAVERAGFGRAATVGDFQVFTRIPPAR